MRIQSERWNSSAAIPSAREILDFTGCVPFGDLSLPGLRVFPAVSWHRASVSSINPPGGIWTSTQRPFSQFPSRWVWEPSSYCRRGLVLVVSHRSHVRLFVTPWTVDHQAFLPIGFSRQEYWSGLPSPTPGDLPNLGIEPMFFVSPEMFYHCTTGEAHGRRLEKKKSLNLYQRSLVSQSSLVQISKVIGQRSKYWPQ